MNMLFGFSLGKMRSGTANGFIARENETFKEGTNHGILAHSFIN